MPNTHVNKVIYGGNTLIDLTADTAVESTVLSGSTFHKANGATATGTCTYDANTQDANAAVAEVLTGKTYYKAGSKLTGTMPNRGAVTGTITTKDQQYTVAQGYHDGSGKVSIDATEQAKIIPTNIREGVTVLGVLGTMSGSEGMAPTQCEVTPYTTAQTITPQSIGSEYNCISEVHVAAIAYNETDNPAGGKTVTIGTVAPS